MLAYDLYKANKDNDSTIVKTITPLKKIFVENGQITVDDIKGSIESSDPSIEALRDWLDMSLNNTSYDKLKLVDITIQSGQKLPYVRIYCKLDKNKISKDDYSHKITMTIGKNESMSTAIYDVGGKTLTFEQLSDVKIRINKDDYFTENGQNLFELYKSSKILTDDGILKSDTFKKIIEKFAEYIKLQNNFSTITKKYVSFSLYILPTKEKIMKKQESDSKGSLFVDAFGTESESYPTGPTKTAKFLSYDDSAFTINCMESDKMYENLGIGNNTLPNIELSPENCINISGYKWVFIDMNTPENKFETTKKGILHQLKSNYQNLIKGNSSANTLSEMKILCMIQDQSKIEIILDENLTLEKQKKIFSNLKESEIPYNALEIMIPKRASQKSKTIWNDYMYVIKSYLTQTPLEKSYFISFFTKQVYKRRFEMIDPKNKEVEKETMDFFSRSDFIEKFLLTDNLDNGMQESQKQLLADEAYAYSMGQIARHYIDYKNQQKEQNNSLLGILKYSKYDKASLQNVLKKIGAGIALSNKNSSEDNSGILELEEKISGLVPKTEISDPSGDYAYFFYKGYFRGGKN